MGLSRDERMTRKTRSLERWTNQFSFRLRLHRLSLWGCHVMNERLDSKNPKTRNRWTNSSTEPIECCACATERITPRDDSFFPSHIKDLFKMNESFKNDPSLNWMWATMWHAGIVCCWPLTLINLWNVTSAIWLFMLTWTWNTTNLATRILLLWMKDGCSCFISYDVHMPNYLLIDINASGDGLLHERKLYFFIVWAQKVRDYFIPCQIKERI